MATSVSGQPVQVNSGDQLGQLTALLTTLFGNKTSQTGTANIAPLQALLTQLQGQDYTQLLNSIFAQAGGQIPGMQSAYANAVGARSGNNSAVQANLEKLMQQTALLGQQQIVTQQQNNQQLQSQVAANIANATRGTITKTPGQAGGLAGMLALTQAALKLTGSNNLEDLWKKVGGSTGMAANTSGPTTGVTAPSAGLTGQFSPLDMGPVQSITGAVAPLDSSFDAYLTGGSVPTFDLGGMNTVPGDAYQPGAQINNGNTLDLGVPSYVSGDAYQPGATQDFADLNLDEFLSNPIYDF